MKLLGLFDSSSEECEHVWNEFEKNTARKGNFDHDTGEFEWISKKITKISCEKCGKTKETIEEQIKHTYKPVKSEKL